MASARTTYKHFWILGLLVLVIVAGGAWWLGTRTQSPQQAAAKASPPEASWITEAVQERVLTATLVMRGDVRPEVSWSIGAPTSVEGPGVVTRLPAAVGTDVAEGAVVIEVSGRPVFVLQGAVPVYRSLRRGLRGTDVAQLQAALARLGFSPELDGVFGKATARAVDAFFSAAGYAPGGGSSITYGEVIFLPRFPARIQSAVTTLGPVGAGSGDPSQPVDGSALVLISAGELQVSTMLSSGDEGLVRVGMPLVLLDEATGMSYPATLTAVAETTTLDQSGRVGRVAIVTPDERLPAQLSGVNLRLTFTTAASDGEVLVVPVAAVSSSANGETRVSVLRFGQDAPVDVAVTAGISADGFVAVEPNVEGALKVGDLVVVGR